MASDRDAVMIALTGTPLIGDGYNTKDVFGEYIHKYYYNRSIADGYTLKLIREGIKTEYRTKMQTILESLETEKGSLSKRMCMHTRSMCQLWWSTSWKISSTAESHWETVQLEV